MLRMRISSLSYSHLADLDEDLLGESKHHGGPIGATVLGHLVELRGLALGPGADVALDEGLVVDLGNLLHLLVYLLPDSGDAKEDGGADGLKSGSETAAEGVGFGEENLRPGDHGAVEVEHLGCNVGKGEIGDEAVFGGERRDGTEHHAGGPSEVVIGDHDSLGVSSGSRGVDERAAVAGLLGLLALDEGRVINGVSKLDEVIEVVHGDLGVDPSGDGLAVDDEGLEVLEILLDGEVLVELLLSLDDDHLGL